MEIQLQELIDQIKKDGVQAAETEAESILKSAKAEAEKIVADAKAQADKILLNAKNENDKMVKSGEEAIRQAGRNLLISFRESVAKELGAVAGETVAGVYSSDALESLIIKAVEAWATNPEAEDLAVILNAEDLKKLEGTMISKLKNKMQNEITLKANDSFNGGFRIAVNDGKVYYDFSGEAVVEMLSTYLSPKVTALLKEAENNG